MDDLDPNVQLGNVRPLYEEIAKLLQALKGVLPLAFSGVPFRGHSGPCGPEAGCDAICADVAHCAEVLTAAAKAISQAESQQEARS